MADVGWQAPPDHLVLSATDLHLWRVQLQRSPQELADLHLLLSSDERDRAARFRQPHHQHRFIAGRGILRSLLGLYLNCDPSHLVFHYSPQGKPYLINQALQFNLAHSQDWAVVGFARSQAVGVDIEQMRPISQLDRLLARFFTAAECSQLLTLPPDQQSAAFVKLWTAREAILKGGGWGLAGLSQVQVMATDDSQGEAIVTAGRQPQTWHYQHFLVQPDYWGAVAVQQMPSTCHTWDWDRKNSRR